MSKDTLICIRDCKTINDHLIYGTYPIKKGELIQDYHEGKIYAGIPNTWIICKDGFQLLYNCNNFLVLSEYRESKIDKICG